MSESNIGVCYALKFKDPYIALPVYSEIFLSKSMYKRVENRMHSSYVFHNFVAFCYPDIFMP